MAEAVDIGQPGHLALVRRQLTDGPPDLPPGPGALDLGRVVNRAEIALADELGRDGPPPSAANGVDAHPPGDLEEPRRQGTGGVEAGGRPPCLKKRLLDGIGGSSIVAQQPASARVHGTGVAPVHVSHRVLVTLTKSLRQRGIVVVGRLLGHGAIVDERPRRDIRSEYGFGRSVVTVGGTPMVSCGTTPGRHRPVREV